MQLIKNLRNSKGSAIPLVMIISALVFVFSYVIFGMLQSRRVGTEDELRALQAKMLAADIIELGKYMLLYERIVYLEDPLSITTARTATRRDFNNQSYGSLAATNSFMLNSCGGYDANAVEVGALTANGSPVFCPFYLRNPLMDGNMFEDMMLTMWARSGTVGQLELNGGVMVTKKATRTAIMKKDTAGAYSFSMDLNSALNSSDNQYIRLHLSQNIIQKMRQDGFTAKLTFSIFGPSTGFKTQSNERFVTLQADVSYGTTLAKHSVNTVESVIIYSSTVKDFAVFMMYPETSGGAVTDKFSEAFSTGASSVFNGRVFFNGDIDTSLDKLPVFNELVVISGSLNTGGFSYEQARSYLAQKFKKGIVTGFPAKRLINDGECIAGIPGANSSGMYCKNPNNLAADFRIADYVQNLGNICSDLKATYASGEYTYNTSGVIDPVKKEQCKGSTAGKVFLSGGSQEVQVNGSYAFMITPVRNLTIQSASNIYGTVMGGHVTAANGTRFFSISSIRKGLPGIPGDNELSAITSEAERINAGVGVPLLNVPLLKDAVVGK